MATVKATLEINANNLTTQQTLSNQIISNLTVSQGGILAENVTAIEGGPATLLTAADYAAGTKVYAKNAGSLNLYLSLEAAGTAGEGAWIKLLPGSWTFFPWFAGANMRVWASANTGCILEYGVFEV
tara:strand:+ start:346 stop:726 length:381 start_codon:yes stop_codon:yes gene_type:complete